MEEDNKIEETDYSGTSHERDSQSENNIVNEVADSFLDYSMVLLLLEQFLT